MAIEEQRLRVRRSLEEKLGMEEASYLMDRPAGGWSELVTNHTLDLKLAVLEAKMDALEHRLLGEIDRRFGDIERRFGDIERRFGGIDQRFGSLAWQLIGAVIAGMAVMGAVFAGMLAIVGR